MNIEEFKNKQAEVDKLRDKLANESIELLKAEFKKIFEENENLKSIAWTQYTPYFNDGNACYFSVNGDDIYLNNETYYHAKSGVELFSKNIHDRISDLIYAVGEDILETLGEGKVYVEIKNGAVEITVDYYEHH